MQITYLSTLRKKLSVYVEKQFNSRRNHANRKIKNNGRIVKIHETRMKIQEASEDLQMGGILFLKFRDKLFKDEYLQMTGNWRLGP